MISVPLSEALIYDLLSIYHVKADQSKTDFALDLHRSFNDTVANRVGWPLHFAVLGSTQYIALKAANLHVFKLVDRLHAEGEWVGAAKEIDAGNYARFLCKRALQKAMFPHEEMAEQKLGYEEVKEGGQ